MKRIFLILAICLFTAPATAYDEKWDVVIDLLDSMAMDKSVKQVADCTVANSQPMQQMDCLIHPVRTLCEPVKEISVQFDALEQWDAYNVFFDLWAICFTMMDYYDKRSPFGFIDSLRYDLAPQFDKVAVVLNAIAIE